MAEYIEREATLREIEWRKEFMVGAKYVSVDAMEIFIKNRPAVNVAPIEALERLRDELRAQDLITMEGLKRLNELLDECANGNEGGNGNG